MGQCIFRCQRDASSSSASAWPSKSNASAAEKSKRVHGGASPQRSGHADSTLDTCEQRTGGAHLSKPGSGDLSTTMLLSQDDRSPRNSGPSLHESEFSLARAHALFNKYKDEREDAILAEGMEEFCQDLSVDPTEFIVLVMAWKFKAATMCRFTRSEFVAGCIALQADTAKAIQARFPELMEEVRVEERFKDLYRFTFQFGLDADEGQRSLPRDMALALWRLVFEHRRPPVLDRWLSFLEENPSSVRGVSRDTWNMFLNFAQTVGPDLSHYSEDEAWPSLFDAFVEWETEQRARMQDGTQSWTKPDWEG